MPLDLRAPQEPLSATVHQAPGTFDSAPFLSAIHLVEPGKSDIPGENRYAEDGARSSNLGARALSFQEVSQAQALAQRLQHIHREGLPIARLWGSQSASLNIGLNQKGKPGLWFTRKVH